MCICLCVYTDIEQNKLICGYASVVHTQVHFVHMHVHTHILVLFEDHELMGLKVDIAHMCVRVRACMCACMCVCVCWKCDLGMKMFSVFVYTINWFSFSS